MNKISKGTITRTAILALALANQLLTAAGHSPLPIDNETMTNFIATGATIVTATVAWWKNNSFTEKAIEADKALKK